MHKNDIIIELEKIESIINGYDFAKDKDRVFTYIEFVKMFGFEHNSDTFITFYKEYVTKWANVKNEEIILSDEEFVLTKMIEILKSITLDYSSYEEQDFIAHVDLTNKDHLKALIAIYSRKIRQITEFYRKKRNESVLIVNKNSFKGSAKSIQEIIYEKVFDYLFSDRNIVPSYVNIKRDLLISVENYVDVYSEYFDIPRNKQFTDKTRAEMLSANMNDIDYRCYLEIELVVSEILFSGNVYLEEIPLIAQLGIDLSQNCVGDMLALKNNLVANTTINQVPLTEQVALKRRLYEKFLGCDLYYMYVDLQGDIKIDVLCKADNPSGNLLNCGTADTATIENEELELLSHIGLFFKPDKTSILKVNAKSFEWSVDEEQIQVDTIYVFPDPSKYGDIGNNKSSQYPLIMEYKLDFDIKNMSSGAACDDPLMFISDQGWRSYYSKQEDDFKLIDNVNYEYSFTYLANQGFIHKYQTDSWGNQFGILKGCDITFKIYPDDYEDESKRGEFVLDENGNKIVASITLPQKYSKYEFTYNNTESDNTYAVLLNGGYFEDPFYEGERMKKEDSDEYIWVYKGNPDDTHKFNFEKTTLIEENYSWSGIGIKNDQLFYSNYTNNAINCGQFGSHLKVQYTDNFQNTGKQYSFIENNDVIVSDVLLPFLSKNVFEDGDYEILTDDTPWDEYESKGGELYIKTCNSLYDKPQKFEDVFSWVDLEGEKITNIHVIHETLIIETKNKIKFIPYSYDGKSISNTLGLRELLCLDKSNFLTTKIIYVENEKKFYILQLESFIFDDEVTLGKYNREDATIQTKNYRRFVIPRFYQFDPINYIIKDVVQLSDVYYKTEYENNFINTHASWKKYLEEKEKVINGDDNKKLKIDLLSQKETDYSNFRDLEIFYKRGETKIGNVDFSYNSGLGIFLLTFSINDVNNTPYLYEYKFKLSDTKVFNDTLVSNIYTLKNEGVNYKWNDKINPYASSTYPVNFKSLGENSIFEYNEKNSFGEEDSYFDDYKYLSKFDQVENDHAQYDEKYHVGYDKENKWEESITDTFGNNLECVFSSDCYITDCETVFERQKRIKTACDLLFQVDDYIKCGENECKVRIRKLEAEGLMNQAYDFLDNGKQPFLGQEYDKDPFWYEVFLSRDVEKTIVVNADYFGNICGNCIIPFENEKYNGTKNNYGRIIKGELRLCLYGSVEDIKVEAHMNVFDITSRRVFVEPTEEDEEEEDIIPPEEDEETDDSTPYDVSAANGYIPDASSWNYKVYQNNDLTVVRVIDGIAYDE